MDHEHDSSERPLMPERADDSKDAKPRERGAGDGTPRDRHAAGGETVAKLLVNEYGKDSREVRISTGTVRLGRDPRSDIVLEDVTVSRSHAEIQHDGDVFLVVDLGSGNGTLVNDSVLLKERSRPLRHGDRLRLGRTLLQFLLHVTRRISSRLKHAPGTPATMVGREREEPHDSPCLFHLEKIEAFLLVTRQAHYAERYRLGSDRTRIGRGARADVVLTDPTVSEKHAEIVYNSEGFHLVDRDSSLGTFLDGVSVSVARLSHRSYLRFGKQQALFVIHDEGEDPLEASFALRDHLIEAYPESKTGIQQAFRDCREHALDFAEELVARAILNPEEWWMATRGYKEKPSGSLFKSSRRWFSKFLSSKKDRGEPGRGK